MTETAETIDARKKLFMMIVDKIDPILVQSDKLKMAYNVANDEERRAIVRYVSSMSVRKLEDSVEKIAVVVQSSVDE